MKTNEPISARFFENELKGFVYKRVRDKALTEDIIHDVFIKVQSKIDQLKETEKITSWIYMITQNAIVDNFRRQSKIINPSELDWDNDEQNFNECVSNCLVDLLPTLPEIYRVALQLTEIENLSQLELAKQLNISYSGAKSRIQRARLLLKQKIDEVLIVKTDAYGNAIICKDRIEICK